MTGYVLFQMWEPFRQSLIAGHLFYVEQAHKRLLSQFNDIEKEADRAADEWLEHQGQRFDPDRDDPGNFYESANDAGIEFYLLLSDMRDRTRLSVVAGMFYELDKQLRAWLAREVRHWHCGDNVISKIWSIDFRKITDLLESLSWKVRSAKYFDVLDACRLVVNVYKHGDGNSFDELKQIYPEYLNDPFGGIDEPFSRMGLLDHTYLAVSDDQLQEFSEAIVEFWQNVPANIIDSEFTSVPDWFERAILKDRAAKPD